MSKQSESALPKPTRDLEQARRDLREWGYCLLLDVIAEDERKRLYDRLMEQAELEGEKGVAYMAEGHSPMRRIGAVDAGAPQPIWQSVATLLNKGREFVDLAMNPKLHALSAHAFQDAPFDLSSIRGLIQRRGATDGPIHIDQLLLPFVAPMPVVCNLTVTLSEYSEANGATRVVPRSHLLRPPHMGGDPAALPEVALEAPPGTAIIWEGRTWHRAAACNSDVTRVAVTVVTNLQAIRQQDVYAASLHDPVYYGMTPEERNFVGFQPSGFNCIFPRFPGDRSNAIAGTVAPQQYIPELRRNPYGASAGSAPVRRSSVVVPAPVAAAGANRHPLLSAAWIAAFQEEVQKLLLAAGPSAANIRYTLAEVFTGAPQEAPHAPGREVGFTLELADGKATVALGVDRNSPFGLLKEGAWDDEIKAAALANDNQRDTFLTGLFQSGRVKLAGNPATIPPFLSRLHHTIAAVTGAASAVNGKFALLSAGWIDSFQREAQRLVEEAGAAAKGISFSLAEVFRNAPADVPRAPGCDVGFTLRFNDGAAVVSLGVDRSTRFDLLKEGEWEDGVQTAHMHVGPERDALLRQQFIDGRIKIEGDPTKAPAFLSNLHNAVAAVTA